MRAKSSAHIDSRGSSVNVRVMDLDELFAKTPGDPLTLLCKEDLDPLSVEELQARIEALEGEIARVKAKLDGSVTQRKAADELFKQ